MKNTELISLQARLYELQSKLTVCVYVLQPGNVFEEDDISGLNCVLCDVIEDLETLNEELTGHKKLTDFSKLPLPDLAELSGMSSPGNGAAKKTVKNEI